MSLRQREEIQSLLRSDCMRIIRYEATDGSTHYGSEAPDGSARRIEGDILNDHRLTDEPADIAKLLAPVVVSSVLCIGLNYRAHAEETSARIPEFPVLFNKGLGSVQNPGDPILLPTSAGSDEVDYEGELAIVMGRKCKNVRKEDAVSHVLGYTCANDVSARDWQIKRGGGQWNRGKSFDTFLPLGPAIVTPDEIPNPNALEIRTEVNGEILQNSNTSDMIFDVPTLIAFLSQSTTLFPGTVILTGTPPGVGMARRPKRWLEAGDTVTIAIEAIGKLTNPVGVE
jgi:2-keto-4-pentenoate hydratase/2-oxohepta-3-ene-1,7-dioic acid hydratase in catechol pathway